MIMLLTSSSTCSKRFHTAQFSSIIIATVLIIFDQTLYKHTAKRKEECLFHHCGNVQSTFREDFKATHSLTESKDKILSWIKNNVTYERFVPSGLHGDNITKWWQLSCLDICNLNQQNSFHLYCLSFLWFWQKSVSSNASLVISPKVILVYICH